MKKKLVCEVCNGFFTDEEIFFEHFFNNHVDKKEEEEKKDDTISFLTAKIKEKYPKAEIDVLEANTWTEKKTLVITYNDCVIRQYVSSAKNTFDEIIWKFETADSITANILKAGEFEYVKCLGYEYGYSSDEHSFHFVFKIKGAKEEMHEHFYPDGGVSEAVFSYRFKQFFLSEIEGEPSHLFSGGYFVGYAIDNIPIEILMKKGKKVKLSILR